MLVSDGIYRALFKPKPVLSFIALEGPDGADHSASASASASGTSPISYLNISNLYLPNIAECVRYQVEFPPGDAYFIYLPSNLDAGVFSFNLTEEYYFGGFSFLDLSREVQVSELFSISAPKALFFYKKSDQKVLEAILGFMKELTRNHQGMVKIYICSDKTCADAINAFGLSVKDLPRAVIDDTVKGQKFVMKKWSTKSKKIESFWRKNGIIN